MGSACLPRGPAPCSAALSPGSPSFWCWGDFRVPKQDTVLVTLGRPQPCTHFSEVVTPEETDFKNMSVLLFLIEKQHFRIFV